MKYLATLVLGLIIPSVSFAAPLTVDQANSLISVVQSSTTTRATAFVPLITAFSNITIPQAESLITVVQAAPGVPAYAFVNMLLAFTVDPVQTVAVQPAPITLTFGSIAPVQNPTVNNAPLTVAPVVQSVVMDKSDIVIVEARQRPADPKGNQPFGSVLFILKVLNADGNDTSKTAKVIMQAPDNIYGESVQNVNTNSGNLFYVPTTGGTKTVTFTSGTITKTIPITF